MAARTQGGFVLRTKAGNYVQASPQTTSTFPEDGSSRGYEQVPATERRMPPSILLEGGFFYHVGPVDEYVSCLEGRISEEEEKNAQKDKIIKELQERVKELELEVDEVLIWAQELGSE